MKYWQVSCSKDMEEFSAALVSAPLVNIELGDVYEDDILYYVHFAESQETLLSAVKKGSNSIVNHHKNKNHRYAVIRTYMSIQRTRTGFKLDHESTLFKTTETEEEAWNEANSVCRSLEKPAPQQLVTYNVVKITCGGPILND